MQNLDGTHTNIGVSSGEQLAAGVTIWDNETTAMGKVTGARITGGPGAYYPPVPLIDFDMGRPKSPEEAAACHEDLVKGNQIIGSILKWVAITLMSVVVIGYLLKRI